MEGQVAVVIHIGQFVKIGIARLHIGIDELIRMRFGAAALPGNHLRRDLGVFSICCLAAINVEAQVFGFSGRGPGEHHTLRCSAGSKGSQFNWYRVIAFQIDDHPVAIFEFNLQGIEIAFKSIPRRRAGGGSKHHIFHSFAAVIDGAGIAAGDPIGPGDRPGLHIAQYRPVVKTDWPVVTVKKRELVGTGIGGPKGPNVARCVAIVGIKRLHGEAMAIPRGIAAGKWRSVDIAIKFNVRDSRGVFRIVRNTLDIGNGE